MGGGVGVCFFSEAAGCDSGCSAARGGKHMAMRQRMRAASAWMRISEYYFNNFLSLGMQNLHHAHEPANQRGRDVLFFGGHWLRFGMRRAHGGKPSGVPLVLITARLC